MKRSLTILDLLYLIGTLTLLIGLFFYHNVIISDNWLGTLSGFLRQEQSTIVIYTGVFVIVIGLLITKDFLRVYKVLKKYFLISFHWFTSNTSTKTKLVILFSVTLFVLSMLLNPIYVFFGGFVILLTIIIYFGVREHIAYLIAAIAILVESISWVEFVFFQNREGVSFLFYTIPSFLFIAINIFYLGFIFFKRIKHKKSSRYIKLLMFNILIVSLMIIFEISFKVSWSFSTGANIIRMPLSIVYLAVFYLMIIASIISNILKIKTLENDICSTEKNIQENIQENIQDN